LPLYLDLASNISKSKVTHSDYLSGLSITPIRFLGTGGTILNIALLATFVVLQSGPADPRIGSWTLTSAQSSLNPANTLSITALHDTVHVVMSGDTHLDFTAKSDGHDTPVTGNPAFDQVDLRRIDKRQSELTEKKNGSIVATIRDRLSNDGHELTITTATVGHPDQVTVWTRSGGPAVAHDPLAGEWTEDLSKTRLRQGLILKIEPDTNGGVHFSGDYSYTARFDGKQYDLRNSRNDAVTLKLIDPHTVDAILWRGNQVAQKDSWVVSADGQQMTLTTSATLETGQHLNEKLVFNKQ
jgi:hypothetical protein